MKLKAILVLLGINFGLLVADAYRLRQAELLLESNRSELRQAHIQIADARNAQAVANEQLYLLRERAIQASQEELTITFYYNANSEGGEVIKTIGGHTVGIGMVKNAKIGEWLAKTEAEMISAIYGRPLQRVRRNKLPGSLLGWGVFVPVWDGLWG